MVCKVLLDLAPDLHWPVTSSVHPVPNHLLHYLRSLEDVPLASSRICCLFFLSWPLLPLPLLCLTHSRVHYSGAITLPPRVWCPCPSESHLFTQTHCFHTCYILGRVPSTLGMAWSKTRFPLEELPSAGAFPCPPLCGMVGCLPLLHSKSVGTVFCSIVCVPRIYSQHSNVAFWKGQK